MSELVRFKLLIKPGFVGFETADDGNMTDWHAATNIIAARDAQIATMRTQVETAINLAVRFGGIDGDHHKAWVIDQMVRALAGEEYENLVKDVCGGIYDWDVGIAPQSCSLAGMSTPRSSSSN